MASAWGLSWNQAWNGAWGVVDGEGPPEPPQPPAPQPGPPRPSGGYPSYDRGPTPEQTRESRIRHGIIESVAARQVAALDVDEIQQRQELEGELRLRGLEFALADLERLNAERERLINAEIAARMHRLIRQREDDAAIALILIAAAVA
jgi:hypothetical protein